jgi:hypothetical protein
MGVTINSLHHMDGYQDKHFGSITHNGHTFDAVLVGPLDRLKSLVHTNATAEYELNEIISVDSGLEKNDTVSGIFPLPNDQIAIDGSIHNETKIDDHFSLLDIYIQNGADFLAVTSEDLGHKPPVGSRIRIVGKGLHVYPTFT